MSLLAWRPGWELEFQFPCRIAEGSMHVSVCRFPCSVSEGSVYVFVGLEAMLGIGISIHMQSFCRFCVCLCLPGEPRGELEFQFPCRVSEGSMYVSVGLEARLEIGISIPMQSFRKFYVCLGWPGG